MNLTDYTYLLNHPDAVNDKQTQALDKIVHEFPYFQSARALRLKGLYNQNSFQYNYALKVAAAYTTDRSVLFDFITSDTFTVIEKAVYQEKQEEIFTIEVKGSEIVGMETPVTLEEKIEQSILTSIKESEKPYIEEEEKTTVAEAEEKIGEEILPESVEPEEIRLEEIQPEEIVAEEIKSEEIKSEEIQHEEIEVEEESTFVEVQPGEFIVEENVVEALDVQPEELKPLEIHPDEIKPTEIKPAENLYEEIPEDEIEVELETSISDKQPEEVLFVPETAQFPEETSLNEETEAIIPEAAEQQKLTAPIVIEDAAPISPVEIADNQVIEEPQPVGSIAAEPDAEEIETPSEPVLPITVHIPKPPEISADELIAVPIIPPTIQPEEVKPVEIAPEPVEDSRIEIPIMEMPNRTIEFVPIGLPQIPEIGKPLEFSKDEKHSFREWLQLSSMKPIVRDEEINDSADHVERKKKTDLIDRFIKSSPKISPVKDFKPAEPSEIYREDNTALMTETLARVYLEQKKYSKAIQAYEILILKYPEKSIFFADRISEIKKLQQNP